MLLLVRRRVRHRMGLRDRFRVRRGVWGRRSCSRLVMKKDESTRNHAIARNMPIVIVIASSLTSSKTNLAETNCAREREGALCERS